MSRKYKTNSMDEIIVIRLNKKYVDKMNLIAKQKGISLSEYVRRILNRVGKIL